MYTTPSQTVNVREVAEHIFTLEQTQVVHPDDPTLKVVGSNENVDDALKRVKALVQKNRRELAAEVLLFIVRATRDPRHITTVRDMAGDSGMSAEDRERYFYGPASRVEKILRGG